MGGIGKTSLVTKLVAQLQPNFTKIVWRSLRNAPPLTNLLPEIIQILSHQTETVPATMDIPAQISRLLHYLRQERCLLVLDNVEAIIQSRSTADSYHHEYSGYTELFRRIGESTHQSCLLLTSREKPEVIIPLEGKELSVRTLTIPGLAAADSENLFDAKGLSASVVGRTKLCKTYSGNPLALNIVATSIYDLFDGDIDEFLALETGIFTGISQLLDCQFDRLSLTEQMVMYWLAIERDWISATDLHAQIVPATTLLRLLTTLESLGRKSLIERSRGKFTQQAVVMEYITQRIVDRVSIELTDRNFGVESSARLQLPLWLSHPLMKAQSPADIRTAQTQLILAPIASQLRLQFGNSTVLERHIRSVLVGLHDRYPNIPQYGGGNLINLLRHLKFDLTDYDFANLFVWQADLQGATLHNVNFSGADLAKSVFTDTFGWISAVAFSPDSQILITGEVNGDLCSWQMDSKHLFGKFIGHKSWIFAISFSPDGRILASASHDMTVRIWDVTTGEVIHILPIDSPLSLSFHPNGQILVTSHYDGTIKFWNVLTGKIIETRTAHSAAIFALTFNPNGRLLATGSDDYTVKIWDVSQSNSVNRKPQTESDADVSMGDCLHTLAQHTKKLWAIKFSPDGNLLATGSADGTIKIWDTETWLVVAVFPVYPDWLCSICFSPDSQMLAAGNSHNEVKIWDVRESRLNSSQPPVAIATLCGHAALVSCVQFSPDGKLLVTATSDRSIRLWHTQTWRALYRWKGYANWIESVAFAPDGTKFISGSQDGKVRLWDVSSGNIIQTFTGHHQGVFSVDYSPNGRTIVSASSDSTVKIWDVQTDRLLHTLSAHQGNAWKVRFSPDGRLFASSGMENTICLWSDAGELLGTLLGHTDSIRAMVFSPDSKLLATGCFGGFWRLWDVETQQEIGCYTGHLNWIWGLAFSPDGKRLASCSADRTIKLWDVSTGELVRTFTGHTAEVSAINFSPNGQHFATGSADKTIKIWEVETGEVFQTLTGHLDRVRTIEYSPVRGASPGENSSLLISGSADETVKIWATTTGDCLRTCKISAPYLGMNIAGATGLNAAAIESLKTLGAVF